MDQSLPLYTNGYSTNRGLQLYFFLQINGGAGQEQGLVLLLRLHEFCP